MKHVLIIVSVFFATMAIGQTKYEAGMVRGLEQLKDAKTSGEMTATSAFFERIGDAEKDKWLPYYYAAYANYMTGWMNPKADKDKVGEKSKELITKAEVLEPENSELYCMKQMVAILQMTVDPMTRWQSYGAEAREDIEKAIKADPTNPRIYYLNGQTLMNTPEAFGGGKGVAKKLFEKALDLYKTFKPASALHPDWGKEQTEKLLAACQ